MKPEEYDEILETLTSEIVKMEDQINYEVALIKNAPKIRVRLVKNTEVNASVGRYDSEYYIGIYMGTAVAIHMVFLRMLAHKTILRHLGDASKEVPIEKVDDIRYPELIQMSRLTGKTIVPKGDERILLAQELLTIVFKYLSDHELGHILYGHVDFGKASLGHQAYNENRLPEDDGLPMDQKFRQACEIQADLFAISRSMRWLQILCEHTDLRLKSIFSGIEESVYLWTFAIYTFWKVAGGELDRVIVAHRGTHPSPETRQTIVLTQITGYFTGFYSNHPEKDEIVKNIVRAVGRGIRESELAFETVSNLKYDKMPDMFRDEIRQYLRDMVPVMEDTSKILEPFALLVNGK